LTRLLANYVVLTNTAKISEGNFALAEQEVDGAGVAKVGAIFASEAAESYV